MMVHGAVIDGFRLAEPILAVTDGRIASDGCHSGASVLPADQDACLLPTERRFELV